MKAKELQETLQRVMKDSLYRDDELKDVEGLPAGAVTFEGIVAKFGFHPERLESHRDEVRAMLESFDDEFYKEKGGGWSFLNMCQTKDGELWGEHHHIEGLVALGKGLGLCHYMMRREMWKSFPGGMPYVMIHLNEEKINETTDEKAD